MLRMARVAVCFGLWAAVGCQSTGTGCCSPCCSQPGAAPVMATAPTHTAQAAASSPSIATTAPVAPAVSYDAVSSLPQYPVTSVPQYPVTSTYSSIAEPTPSIQTPSIQTRTISEGKIISSTSRANAGHATDYRWLEGTLEYSHSDSGRWKLRYTPMTEEDPFGGSVVLDSDPRLGQFQPGDRVRVEGEMVQNRSSVYLPGPLYRVHKIERSRGN